MRVKKVTRKFLDKPEPVFDIYKANPHNNFLVKAGDTGIVSHNCGLMDEIDFASGANIKIEKSKIMKIYTTIKRRMESRYLNLGELPGILFMVSSKKSEHDFLEQYVKTVENNPNVLVVDEPVWNIKPPNIYSGKTFQVAMGNKQVRSKIVGENEDPKSYEEQGYEIIDVPVEHRQAFELDPESALCDIAGISSKGFTKFMNYGHIKACYDTERQNPFKSNVLTIGLRDNLEIKDFFLPDLIPERIRYGWNFIHIDTSYREDLTGISMISVGGETKNVRKYNQGELVEEIDAVFTHVFSVGIQPPADSEISFAKTRDFIYYLRSLGYNISGISTDGYQSQDTLQNMIQAGYNAKLVSVDKKPDPYLALRNALAEGRVNLLQIEELERELLDLERDNITGKIDHSQNSSKDLADSLCGALFNATQFKQLPYLKHASSDSKTAIEQYSGDADRQIREERELIGIDPDTKIVRSVDDLLREQDDDVIDF